MLPAISQESPPASPPVVVDVDLGPTATVISRGAAVVVPVTLTCAPGADFASLSVQLTQRRLALVARGFGFVDNVTCTGLPTQFDIVVEAQLRAFGRGQAFATADLFAFYGGQLVTDSDDASISVRR